MVKGVERGGGDMVANLEGNVGKKEDFDNDEMVGICYMSRR